MTPEEKLSHLPDAPGVYFFRDTEGKVIYVGKAVSLKNRVRSYYQAGTRYTPKIRSMMDRARDFEYIVTDNEVEALVLESNLIKEHRPRYNVVLKDDKSYPFLKVTLGEDFPRVHITRRPVQDGSRYFGPYTHVGAVHETLTLLRRLFPFRTCKQKLTGETLQQRPCLNYHIKRCLAPCCGMVTQEDYRTIIQEVCLFLEGRQEDLVKRLTSRMKEAARMLEFEKAAELRNQLQSIQEVMEKQKVVSIGRGNQDAFAVATRGSHSCVMVFFVRGGKVLGKEHFVLQNTEDMNAAEIITAFVKQYYHHAEYVPEEVLLTDVVSEEIEVITRWLSQKKGSTVHCQVPRRGEKKKLMEMVAKNALLALQEAELEEQKLEKAPAELARELGLEKVPLRLECFDVSNIQGNDAVASMVVFENGQFRRDQYRRFKIRTVDGPNDFASLQESLKRRFSRGLEERKLLKAGQLSTKEARFHFFPDLVIVDGGKGQLSAAREVMRELSFEHIPACALAKEEELIFLENRQEPVRLPRNSPALQLVQHLRDEAHRFAVTYHRLLRTRRNLKSFLDEIEGIGTVRKRALLKAFPSAEAIARASVEELAAIPGMNRPAAEAVVRYFQGKPGEGS